MSIPGPDSLADARYIDSTRLEAFVDELFLASGLLEADARRAAQILVENDLRGVWSHGVARVAMYRARIREGVAKARPSITAERVAPAAVLVDGDDGLGLVVAPRAMDEAIALAKQMGIAVAGVRRSGHFSTSSPYLRQAIEAGCIAFTFTTGSPALAPWGAAQAFLGTSPLGFAAPTPPGAPFLIDLAMSRVARGKLKFAAARGQDIPEGYALSKDGMPTTDGKEAFKGIMLPFGEHKGAALSWMMDVLAGAFVGAGCGGSVANPFTNLERPQGVGHLFIVLRADLFVAAETFAAQMGELHARAKNLPKAPGFTEILSPGELEARQEALNRKRGVPLTADVLESLNAEAQDAAVAWPFGS